MNKIMLEPMEKLKDYYIEQFLLATTIYSNCEADNMLSSHIIYEEVMEPE